MLEDVAQLLLSWFAANGRDFPFRWQKDPYKVLVAGILLRKTRAPQVAFMFPTIINKYDDPHRLAEADEEELRTLIKPLGITSRAGVLIELARVLIQQYGGNVPPSYDELIKLPSVGDYVASCVLALGYGQALPMVDVNVVRVLGRIYGAQRDIHRIYSHICPQQAAESFHYAILDLGQLICKHSNPKCGSCPVLDACEHLNHKRQAATAAL